MYNKIFAALSLPLDGEVLGISGLKYWVGSKHYQPPQEVIAKTAHITNADYPEVDICNMPYADNSLDWIICDCVLEHVEHSPQTAVEEMYRVLKPGGSVIITSAFMYPVHWGPKDLWRFHPDGLRVLCSKFSKITLAGSWGNRWAQLLFMLYPKAQDWKVPNRSSSILHKLATRSDSKYPMMTWIIAQK
jgi:SAM-dependent methyltransferase